MIRILSSTFTPGRTESSVEDSPTQNTDNLHYVSCKVVTYKTSNASSSESFYHLKPPTNINVIERAAEKVAQLHDVDVQRQTAEILATINSCLLENTDIFKASNRLSPLHLTEQNDKSALIEWNFESFRIGFSIEPTEDETSYFIVSEDKAASSFQAETHRLGNDFKRTICEIASYVIRNT